jgi:hypothetical protein
VLVLTVAASAPAAAQSTTLSLYQDMALECLGELPPQLERIVLEAPDEMPYVRAALVEAWQEDGRQVYLPGASIEEGRLSYDIEEAYVRYARNGRRLAREVRLTLHYTIANEEGRLLADRRCAGIREDVIARSQVDTVESAVHPETQAALPRGGWFRRVLEPAVLTSAAVVTIYLFFTLRSAGGDDS